MMSWDGSEPPRLEPDRTGPEEPETPARRSLRDELRQWGIRKTFVHQFRLLATRILPVLAPRKRGGDDGDRYNIRDRYERDHLHPHRRFKTKPKKKKARTATGHAPDDPARPQSVVNHVLRRSRKLTHFYSVKVTHR